MANDSPLSIAGNVAGLLTLVVTIILSLYARALALNAKLHYQSELIMTTVETLEACYQAKALVGKVDKFSEDGSLSLGVNRDGIVEFFVDIFELKCRLLNIVLRSDYFVASIWGRKSVELQFRLSDIKTRLVEAQQNIFLSNLRTELRVGFSIILQQHSNHSREGEETDRRVHERADFCSNASASNPRVKTIFAKGTTQTSVERDTDASRPRAIPEEAMGVEGAEMLPSRRTESSDSPGKDEHQGYPYRALLGELIDAEKAHKSQRNPEAPQQDTPNSNVNGEQIPISVQMMGDAWTISRKNLPNMVQTSLDRFKFGAPGLKEEEHQYFTLYVLLILSINPIGRLMLRSQPSSGTRQELYEFVGQNLRETGSRLHWNLFLCLFTRKNLWSDNPLCVYPLFILRMCKIGLFLISPTSPIWNLKRDVSLTEGLLIHVYEFFDAEWTPSKVDWRYWKCQIVDSPASFSGKIAKAMPFGKI